MQSFNPGLCSSALASFSFLPRCIFDWSITWFFPRLPAPALRLGPRSRPELRAATPCSTDTIQKGLNSGEHQLHSVNPGFSALISAPVICISLLCEGFSSFPSAGPGAGISIRRLARRLQGPRCAPACAICRRHQFFSTFLISHYSQAHAAPTQHPPRPSCPRAVEPGAVRSLPDPTWHALACRGSHHN